MLNQNEGKAVDKMAKMVLENMLKEAKSDAEREEIEKLLKNTWF